MICADLAQGNLIGLLQYEPLPQHAICTASILPNRYLSSKVGLFLEAVEKGLNQSVRQMS